MSPATNINDLLKALTKRSRYRQTDFKPLLAVEWQQAELSKLQEHALTKEQFDAIPDHALVWVNGVLQQSLSTTVFNNPNVTITTEDKPAAIDLQDPNLVLFNESPLVPETTIVIADQAEIAQPIALVFITTKDVAQSLVMHNIHIQLGQATRCQFALHTIQCDDIPTWLHHNIHWTIAQDADCCWHHYMSPKNASNTSFVTQEMHSTIAKHAHMKQFSASAHQPYLYHHHDVVLKSEHAHYEAYGFYRAFDKDRVHYRIHAEHEGKDTKSHQFFRGILGGHSKALFDSVVRVYRGAKGSDSKQMNNNLLLDPLSSIQSLPILEINEEDVACQHGATVGALDETMLFYLQSRGLNEKESMRLMKQAFIAEVIQAYDSNQVCDALRANIMEDIQQWSS